MKHIFHSSTIWLLSLMLSLLVAEPKASAQTPAWQTAVALGGPFSSVTASAADANGDVYVAGFFERTASFGNTVLTSAGETDAFVAKWSSANNNFVWAQRAGGAYEDIATSVALSGNSVYIGGAFKSSTAGFGAINLTNAGGQSRINDVFVAKLADFGSNASFAWAVSAGGSYDDRVSAIATNGNSVYVTGSFYRTAAFGNIVLNAATYGSVFVGKLVDGGSTGSFAWVQQAQGDASIDPVAIAASGNGVYVVGNFNGASITVGRTVLANVGAVMTHDIFVTKLVDAGSVASFAWAQRAGGTGSDFVRALAASGTGVYITGDYSGANASFGTVVLPAPASANYNSDIFVAKVTGTNGTADFTWAQQAGGTGNDQPLAVASIGASLYIAGYFDGTTATFGSVTLNGAYPGTKEIWVAKLTDTGFGGSFRWAQQAGGTGSDMVRTLAVGGGRIYVGGSFDSPGVSFGNVVVFGQSFPYTTGFLASLTDPTLTATAPVLHPETIGLAPNPAHATATVQFPPVPGAATATLTLLDALGRTVRTRTVAVPGTGLRYELDLTGLAPSLYALRVTAGTQTATRRLVVE